MSLMLALAFAAPAGAQDAMPTDPAAMVDEAVEAALDAAADADPTLQVPREAVQPPAAPPPDAAPVSETTAPEPAVAVPAPESATEPAVKAPAPDPAPAPRPAAPQPGGTATQTQPVNLNISVRVLSPGDDGPVTQTNLAAGDGAGGDGTSSVTTLPGIGGSPTLVLDWTWIWNWTWITESVPEDVGGELPGVPLDALELPGAGLRSHTIPEALRDLVARVSPPAAPEAAAGPKRGGRPSGSGDRERTAGEPPGGDPVAAGAPASAGEAGWLLAATGPVAARDSRSSAPHRRRPRVEPVRSTPEIPPAPETDPVGATAAAGSASVFLGLAIVTTVWLLSLPWLNTKLVMIGLGAGRAGGPPRGRPG